MVSERQSMYVKPNDEKTRRLWLAGEFEERSRKATTTGRARAGASPPSPEADRCRADCGGRSADTRTRSPEIESEPSCRLSNRHFGSFLQLSSAYLSFRHYGRASRIILNGVSAARRNRVNPPFERTSRRRRSPACAPRARPTS